MLSFKEKYIIMKYITLNDLVKTIRERLYKIPRDIDFIIGIPRSGMIAASIISTYLNVPLIDINSYCQGMKPYGGLRCSMLNQEKYNKALVVDDTVFNGTSMYKTKQKLSNINDTDFIYLCVYIEGRGINMVDIYLEDVRQYTNNFTNIVLYEWNIFQHYDSIMSKCLYDIDGVLCVEPPDERSETEYLKYIENATPLFVPKVKIGGIMTYRLIKNKEITENWLKKNNIKYNELIMFNANTWEERNKSGITPEKYKGNYYKTHNDYELFVESSDYQARMIAEISNKRVYCVETNKMY